MASLEEQDNPAWPPGTVRLEEEDRASQIIQQPQPSRDPNDPLNWPNRLKYWNFGLAAFYTLMVFALIDAATPTWAPMHEQLGFSYDILNTSYAVGCGALAIGACVLIPFALKYGRRPIYICSTAIQFGVSIWSAHQQTVADLMMVNILSCFMGALAETVVQMTVADVFFVNQRGTMNAIFFWSTRIGASLAPLAAGYVTISQGWRWVWWWIAIFFGVLLLAMIFGYEETKFVTPPIDGVSQLHQPGIEGIRRSKDTDHPLSSKEPNTNFTVSDIDSTISRKSYRERLALTTSSPGSLGSFVRHCYQPFQILFSVPGVFYMSLVYGAMMISSNILVTTLSNWMTRAPYNFNPDQIGLMSLAPFTGSTLGTLICGPLSDWWILYLSRRNKGIYEPEMRLWVMAAFAPFVPIGMILFGVGLSSGWPWPVLAVSYALCSFGTAPAGTISLTYITDAYTEVVGDAMVGVTFIRNMCSFIIIFALPPWIAAAGVQTVYIVIGVFITAILFGSGIFIVFGKRFRFRFRKSKAYFENVHLQYPFLHEPTFRKWEKDVAGPDSACADPTQLFFVNMVYAIGALLKSNPKSLPQQLYASALLHLDHVLSKKNLESIQALLCCALFSIRSATGPSVWNLSGLALRQCIELGYHRSIKKMNLRTSVLRLELRKRVFWCAYQMDCAASVNLGLPLSLPIQEVDTEEQLSSLRKDVDEWMAETPAEPLRAGVPLTVFANAEDWRLTYYETILFLYRGKLTDRNSTNEELLLECTQAASNICQSCKRLYIGKPINYTWSTLHVLFLAGLTYMHCLWTSPAVRQAVRIDSASNIFTTCTMLLAIMAERWEAATPYRNLFEALSSRTMAMMVERNQQERQETLPSPSESGNANVEDLTNWAAQIADVNMPDAYGSLLSGLIGDFGTQEEAQEFYDSLWNF
ncbi:major facilitator superfamily transporter [Colletotrichum karsti]|uniref:Major facilitator superfamily transporter n=1 Tax=Colletotrichum karsti TaxID=1095194 RepID=A0A9P6LFS0_9PEZI|nr:major facilitator superfamily transporter [Colletotrichum karsti]KAF9874439.1 major facilitator superfamily transporter [Colletotrichum karsti]